MSVKLLTWASTFVIIVLCELGDKTQLAVLLMTSKNPGRRWLIFSAAALALTCCVIVEVTIGLTLSKFLGPKAINRLAGIVFLLMGIYGFTSILRSKRQPAEQEVEQTEA